MKKEGFSKYILVFIVVVILLASCFYCFSQNNKPKEISLSSMTNNIKNEKIEKLKVDTNKMTLTATLKTKDKKVYCRYTEADYEVLNDKYLMSQMARGKIKVSVIKTKQTAKWISSFSTILFLLILLGFWYSTSGKNLVSSPARSIGKGEDTGVTFDDVAGLDEEKQELQEVVDFLKKPEKYENVGAKVPKGVLLVGPPGTGKTYLSKAMAGEAKVPFFSISGSEFVEMFVGVGASRVRSLFKKAKESAPCIVFIDEIDAVGRKRGTGLGGGNDEKEQTLNQLLVEMDGFEQNSGIVVLGATNRPDVLDPAIMRPGRFSRQIVIGLPDMKGREEIFKVYSKGLDLESGVDAKVLARRTPGFSPADIENLMNEAALLTAREDKGKIGMEEIEKAITRVIAGPEKKSHIFGEEEKKITAIHEAGHAVAADKLPKVDPVHMITIIPHGMAGGFTETLPEKDRNYATKGMFEQQLVHLLAGRCAEELMLSDISTGASNDIKRATELARDMVSRYGFSTELGPVAYDTSEDAFLGKDLVSKKVISEKTEERIDNEVQRLLEKAYKRCREILVENKEQLKMVSEKLLETETINAEEFKKIRETASSIIP